MRSYVYSYRKFKHLFQLIVILELLRPMYLIERISVLSGVVGYMSSMFAGLDQDQNQSTEEVDIF